MPGLNCAAATRGGGWILASEVRNRFSGDQVLVAEASLAPASADLSSEVRGGDMGGVSGSSGVQPEPV